MTPNPFSSLQPPGNGSEQIVQAKPAALDEAVEKAYRVYEGLGFDILGNYSKISGLEKQILSPSQIDGLLQVIISKTEPEKLNQDETGLYLTWLIQASYDAGNNDFVLTTRDTHILGIGYKLSGSKEKRLKIRIDGNAGYCCGRYANFSEITIYGDVRDWCFEEINSSEITIYGNADNCCGYHANSSEITIYGNASEGCGFRASNTKFIAHNEKAYDLLKDNVRYGKGNTIRLVNSKGKVIKEEHL